MTESLDPIVLNFLYAGLGGMLTMGFAWMSAKLFSHIMEFSTSEELKKGNVAVGLVYMGIFIATGTGMGLVIGMSLN